MYIFFFRTDGHYRDIELNKVFLTTEHFLVYVSKKSPTGPSERTPKPEYLTVLATHLGSVGKVPLDF